MPPFCGLECHVLVRSHGRWKPLVENETVEESADSRIETTIYVKNQKFAVRFVAREYVHGYLQVYVRDPAISKGRLLKTT